MAKKILIFSVAYQPFIGGAEMAVAEITKRLVTQGFNFDLLTVNLDGKQKKEEIVGGVKVFRLGGKTTGKLFFPFLGCLKAFWLHRKNHYDFIWSIMANRAGFAALFFKIFHPAVPFILTLQEGDLLDYPKRRMGLLRFLLMPFFKMIFRRADKVTAISNYLAEWGREMGAKNVVVIPNGVDLKNFQFFPTLRSGSSILQSKIGTIFNFQKEEFRKKMGLEKDDVVLVTTGRLVKKNGVGDIIAALKFLPENVKLLVVGKGDLENVLRLSAQGGPSLGGQARVIFTGFVPPEKLPDYLWASDIFVRPSLSEGLGNSFIEALAAGLPIIGTPVGGIPDFLKDGETGLFCQPNNPQSIAEKIKLLLADSLLRQKIIANGQKLVTEKYDWNLIAEKMGKMLM